MVVRNTSQRQAIRDVFEGSQRPLTTQEVLDAAQSRKPGMGIATVYRTLRLLLDGGYLRTVKLPGQPPRYEKSDKPHHHHFFCQSCGRVFEVPGYEDLLKRLVPAGFALVSHEVALYGQCRECRDKQVPPPAARF